MTKNTVRDGSCRRPFPLAAVATVGFGAFMRWRLLASSVGRLDSDEGVVGLMADNMRAGKGPYLFFWGQHYGGTLEPMITAVAFVVHRSASTLKAVPLALSVVCSYLTCRIGAACFDRRRGHIAGALLFAWPGTTWLATKERGFLWITMALVLGAVLVGIRIAKQSEPNWRLRDTALLGLLVGFAWYQSAQAIAIGLPLAIWLCVVKRPGPRQIAIATVGVAVGASPWIYGLWRDGASVLSQPRGGSTYINRVAMIFGESLPRAIGILATNRGGWLFGTGMGVATYGLLIASALVFGVRAQTPTCADEHPLVRYRCQLRIFHCRPFGCSRRIRATDDRDRDTVFGFALRVDRDAAALDGDPCSRRLRDRSHGHQRDARSSGT